MIRHTDDADFTGYQFGEYGQPGFFLLVLLDDTDFDRPGRSTLGFLVPDLDASHHRALKARRHRDRWRHDSRGNAPNQRGH